MEQAHSLSHDAALEQELLNMSRLAAFLASQNPEEQTWHLERLNRELQNNSPEQLDLHLQALEKLLHKLRQSEASESQQTSAEQFQAGLLLLNLVREHLRKLKHQIPASQIRFQDI